MPNLFSSTLLSIFEDILENDPYYKSLSTKENPCHFTYEEREFYAYIKNLSPAYLGNDDVWRAQLTNCASLEEIKKSEATFLFLGYDDQNDVFATWNPYKVKQRIDTAKSPSFYSRLSVQEEVSKSAEPFKKLPLSNEQEVLIFKADYLPKYLLNVDLHFPDRSEYVAIGSKRRPEANEAYRRFTDLANVEKASKWFQNIALNDEGREYMENGFDTIANLIKDGTIQRNKAALLKYDRIADYKSSEIPEIDPKKQIFLDLYIAWFINWANNETVEENIEGEYEESEDLEEKDWEADYINNDGKLTRIKNPQLIEQLREPLTGHENRELVSAYNIIDNFYGERFPNMSLSDWSHLIDSIDWNGDNDEGTSRQTPKEGGKRRYFTLEDEPALNLRRFILRAVHMIWDTVGPVTFDEFKALFPERSSSNDFFVSQDVYDSLRDDQKNRYFNEEEEVFTDNNGLSFYLSNQWKITDAQETFFPILDDYGIKWKEVENDDTERTPQPRPKRTYEKKTDRTSVRLKIFVTMPDGEQINGNNVAETYCRTISKIGPEHIRALNLTRLSTNLIATEDEIPDLPGASYQPVGGGYYVNTHSSTKDKLNWLVKINELLNLGMNIEMREPATLFAFPPQEDDPRLGLRVNFPTER